MKEDNTKDIIIIVMGESESAYPRIDDDGFYVTGPPPTITGTLLAFAGVIFVLWLLGEFVLWLSRLF